MISNASQAFVWLWLPRCPEPVVAGKMSFIEDKYHFVYGRSYLENEHSISLSPIELPLVQFRFSIDTAPTPTAKAVV
ncbi:MAG TPA: hypothetical protein ENG03_08030 [Thioploca sp.]|nr:MAG: hypothetical protein DRR19_03680 [Gammaproteobacteria bacterium]HDN27026.1 hypothetical protein [Thioploca sp.]